MYSKDGARLFQDGEDVPSGYEDCPTKVDGYGEEELDIDELRAKAKELGIKVHHKAKAETILAKIKEAE